MNTEEMTLEDKLKLIAKAIEEAKGDPQREVELLEAIADPQESLNCEGCQ